jgi:hypothetical protein
MINKNASTDLFSSTELFVSNGDQEGPFFRYSVSPSSIDLDPYWFFTKFDENGNLVPNNDYRIVVKDYDSPENKDFNLQKDPAKYEVRVAATKAPIVVSGWGYDIAGIPAPAIEKTRNFDTETPLIRKKWKTGPLDIRWDDERKVWAAGPEVIEGILLEDIDGTDDPFSPKKGQGQIWRGYKDWTFGTFEVTSNSDPINAIRPSPFAGDPYSGEGGEKKERVVLYNRSSSSFSKDEYFLAIKINYEWRIISGGGGGGSGEGDIILVLGDYERYKDCFNKLPCNKGKDENGNLILCAPTYAWSSYKICGCKYIKTGNMDQWAYPLDMIGGGLGWAHALRGSGVDKDGNPCGGIRFISPGGGPGQGGCCPKWLQDLECIKADVTYISKPECSENCLCERPTSETYWDPMADSWGKTKSYEMLNTDRECNHTVQIEAEYALTLYIISLADKQKCWRGPEEFDPCDPCSGTHKFFISLNGNKANIGNASVVLGGWTITWNQLKTFAEKCLKSEAAEITLTNFEKFADSKCPNPVEKVVLRCCP